MKIIILIIVSITVFFLAVIFGVKNTQSITLAYIYGLETPPFPMYYLIFIPFIIGFVVGGLCGFIRRLHLHNIVRALQKSKSDLEEKLKQIKEAQIVQEVEAQMLEEKSTETEVIPTT